MALSDPTPSTILLQVNDRHSERPLYELPVKASNTVTPGHFIGYDGSDCVPAAVGQSFPMVAVENPYIYRRYNDSVGKAIDTAYNPTAGTDLEPCRYIIPQRGDLVYAFIDDGEDISKGDLLAIANTGSTGTAGTLVAVTPDATTVANTLLAIADEAVDNSAGGAPARCKVRIL